MKSKIVALLLVPCMWLAAQPYNFIQAINPADTGLISSPSRKTLAIQPAPSIFSIDGVIEYDWGNIFSHNLDRYIMCMTKNNAGIYLCEPLAGSRTPDNSDDFSAKFKVSYDDDYLYLLYDVTDNEINDNVLTPGTQERIEVMIAPYADSAQQLLKGKAYPPFSGSAPLLNKRFCYWHYLGAFKINFFLEANGSVTINYDERADATKINYAQRVQACQAAWKVKGDGSGYVLEAALSLKVSLADSANNPFDIPIGVQKIIAFDVSVFDKDHGMNQIVSSWNAQDLCRWDNMLYIGKMIFNATSPAPCPKAMPIASDVAVCSGTKATLTASGGKSYRWYTTSFGGTPISTSASYTTPTLYSTTTYYVANYDSCESTRKAVEAGVVNQSNITITPLANSKYNCKTAPEKLSASPSGGTFSGDGVEMGYFVPSQAQAGHINTIYYSVGTAGCSATDSINVYVFPCDNIDGIKTNNASIYPNPSDGRFTIHTGNNVGLYTIQIIDASGRIVAEEKSSVEGNQSISCDYSYLSPGVYIVKCIKESNTTIVKLIINSF